MLPYIVNVYWKEFTNLEFNTLLIGKKNNWCYSTYILYLLFRYVIGFDVKQGVPKGCRLSWLTNRAPREWAQMRGEGRGCEVSANEFCVACIRLYFIGPCQVHQRRRSRAQIQHEGGSRVFHPNHAGGAWVPSVPYAPVLLPENLRAHLQLSV